MFTVRHQLWILCWPPPSDRAPPSAAQPVRTRCRTVPSARCCCDGIVTIVAHRADAASAPQWSLPTAADWRVRIQDHAWRRGQVRQPGWRTRRSYPTPMRQIGACPLDGRRRRAKHLGRATNRPITRSSTTAKPTPIRLRRSGSDRRQAVGAECRRPRLKYQRISLSGQGPLTWLISATSQRRRCG